MPELPLTYQAFQEAVIADLGSDYKENYAHLFRDHSTVESVGVKSFSFMLERGELKRSYGYESDRPRCWNYCEGHGVIGHGATIAEAKADEALQSRSMNRAFNALPAPRRWELS